MSVVAGIRPHQFSSDKVFFHTRRLQEVLGGKVVMPSVYEISPVGYCTQKCVYCVSRGYQSRLHLTKSQMENIISQIAEVGGLAITFTGGGEPLLHPYLAGAIELASDKGLSIGLITNGAVRLSEQVVNTLVDHLSFCRISLDTIDKALYRQLRGVDTLSLVLKNIEALVRAKVRRGAQVLLGVQVVWVNQSHSDIEATIRYFLGAGVDFVQIRPVDNVPSDTGFYPPFYLKADEHFLRGLQERFSTSAFQVLLSADKWNEVFEGRLGKGYTGCPGANFTAAIGHDYRVYFCCTHIGNEAFYLGDLREAPLRKILLGSKRRTLIGHVEHSHCQNQCRNHVLNKIITSLQNMDDKMVQGIIATKASQPKPLHWEFL